MKIFRRIFIVSYLMILLLMFCLLLWWSLSGYDLNWYSFFFVWLLIGWVIVVYEMKWKCGDAFKAGFLLVISGIVLNFFGLTISEFLLRLGVVFFSVGIIQAVWEYNQSVDSEKKDKID